MSELLSLDLRDNAKFIAAVTVGDGRPMIDSLRIGTPEETIDTTAGLAVVVPDSQAMVKSLFLKNGAGDLHMRLKFELAQSLLEPENLFLFDAFSSGIPDRFTGLIYRRERLDELRRQLGLKALTNTPRYLARAAALGVGYRSFCIMEGGDLQCVADLTRQEASLCFLYRGSIAALASMSLSGYDLNFESSLRRLAKEFKTLVNFKLAGLAEQGVTIPLSVVVLIGEPVNNQLFDMLSGFFPIGVASPRFNRAYLATTASSHLHPELFLPALGAAVN